MSVAAMVLLRNLPEAANEKPKVRTSQLQILPTLLRSVTKCSGRVQRLPFLLALPHGFAELFGSIQHSRTTLDEDPFALVTTIPPPP